MLNKVLCIDDDPITLMICRIMLQKSRFCGEMDEAANGQIALDYFERLSTSPSAVAPELVLLDINMPVMNGWEFLQAFTERYSSTFPNSKIVILSSSICPNDRPAAESNPHVISCLTKPLTVAALEKLKQLRHNTEYFQD